MQFLKIPKDISTKDSSSTKETSKESSDKAAGKRVLPGQVQAFDVSLLPQPSNVHWIAKSFVVVILNKEISLINFDFMASGWD